MPKPLIPSIIFVIYTALLIKFMVFKDGLLRLGHLRLRLTPDSGKANFIPFKSIGPYLVGYPSWPIAILNLAGNIIPLMPIGFLVPFIYRKMTWRKSLVLAVMFGLVFETTEKVFSVGIFDVDDIILNALGVMIGYFIFAFFEKRSKRTQVGPKSF